MSARRRQLQKEPLKWRKIIKKGFTRLSVFILRIWKTKVLTKNFIWNWRKTIKWWRSGNAGWTTIKINKPLIIHCRDAHDDLLKILKANNSKLKIKQAGVMHFFTGNYEQAKQYIDLGFYISFSGVITFASEYEELVRKLPLDKILIETDAPYATPVPYRGQRNEPSYVIETAKKIAEIKNISLDETARQTTENAFIVFGLKT